MPAGISDSATAHRLDEVLALRDLATTGAPPTSGRRRVPKTTARRRLPAVPAPGPPMAISPSRGRRETLERFQPDQNRRLPSGTTPALEGASAPGRTVCSSFSTCLSMPLRS